MTTTPKFGSFESNPCRFTDYEKWVYQHDVSVLRYFGGRRA
jgi:hypothetical protein